MPCNTIVRSKVEFLAQSTNVNLLKTGLESLGYHVNQSDEQLVFTKNGRRGSYDANTGRLELAVNWDGEEIKRGYSEAVVNDTAKKNGWQISWSTNASGNRDATVLRRGF